MSETDDGDQMEQAEAVEVAPRQQRQPATSVRPWVARMAEHPRDPDADPSEQHDGPCCESCVQDQLADDWDHPGVGCCCRALGDDDAHSDYVPGASS